MACLFRLEGQRSTNCHIYAAVRIGEHGYENTSQDLGAGGNIHQTSLRPTQKSGDAGRKYEERGRVKRHRAAPGYWKSALHFIEEAATCPWGPQNSDADRERQKQNTGRHGELP